MKKRPACIIPDADVIIHLHEMGVWDDFISSYKVYVAKTVIDDEVWFYTSEQLKMSGEPDGCYTKKTPIDLRPLISQGRITEFDPDAKDLLPMKLEEQQMQAPEIHAGERDSIAATFGSQIDLMVCLIDRAAIEYAVLVGKKDHIMSLEAALSGCGLGRPLPKPLTDRRFQRIVEKAAADRVQKLGL